MDKQISEEFITFMKNSNRECPCARAIEWFTSHYHLDSEELAEDIHDYICKNLGTYGYVISSSHSSQKGNLYCLDKVEKF